MFDSTTPFRPRAPRRLVCQADGSALSQSFPSDHAMVVAKVTLKQPVSKSRRCARAHLPPPHPCVLAAQQYHRHDLTRLTLNHCHMRDDRVSTPTRCPPHPSCTLLSPRPDRPPAHHPADGWATAAVGWMGDCSRRWFMITPMKGRATSLRMQPPHLPLSPCSEAGAAQVLESLSSPDSVSDN